MCDTKDVQGDRDPIQSHIELYIDLQESELPKRAKDSEILWPFLDRLAFEKHQ